MKHNPLLDDIKKRELTGRDTIGLDGITIDEGPLEIQFKHYDNMLHQIHCKNDADPKFYKNVYHLTGEIADKYFDLEDWLRILHETR